MVQLIHTFINFTPLFIRRVLLFSVGNSFPFRFCCDDSVSLCLGGKIVFTLVFTRSLWNYRLGGVCGYAIIILIRHSTLTLKHARTRIHYISIKHPSLIMRYLASQKEASQTGIEPLTLAPQSRTLTTRPSWQL